jgi:hypothetical protein
MAAAEQKQHHQPYVLAAVFAGRGRSDPELTCDTFGACWV